MKLLPHNVFEIRSPLSPADAQAALAAHTEVEKFIRWGGSQSGKGDRFEGAVTAETFRIRRIIGYRNSFLPVIEGAFHRDGRGTRIAVRMRMFVFIYIFAAVWVTGVSLALFSSVWPIALAMLVFLYVMIMIGFWFEASKQERVLREIFRSGTI